MATADSGVRIEGLAQAIRQLQALGVEVDDLKDVMAQIASVGASEATRRAPVRSGRLSASIRGNRAKGKATVMAGGATVPYAAPIHYGWPARHIAPHPFIDEAVDQLAPRLPGMFQDGINSIIRKRGLQ